MAGKRWMGALSFNPLPKFSVLPAPPEQAETSWQSASGKRRDWQSGHSGSNNLPGKHVPISLCPCGKKISWMKAFRAGNRQTIFFHLCTQYGIFLESPSLSLLLSLTGKKKNQQQTPRFIPICTIKTTYEKHWRRNRWRVLERRWKAE